MKIRETLKSSHLVLLASLLYFSSCIGKKSPEVLNTSRVERLLGLDTGKVWVRTALRINGDNSDLLDCELQNFYWLSFDDADTAFYVGAPINCAQVKTDTLNKWSLKIVSNVREEFLDSLEFTDESGVATFRKIRELTSNNLQWEYIEESNEIRETLVWLKNPQN